MGRGRAGVVLVLLVGALVAGWANDAAGMGISVDATATSARSSGRLPPRLRARLGAAVHRAFREAAAPGVIVGVQTPKGKWVTAIGIANQRSKAPMKPSIHQRIGSVTKTFMGTLLMQLASEHKLSLGDKVSKYIKGVPNGDTMTLRQVADMTSGVASYTADPVFTKALYSHPERRWRPRELLAIGLRDSPVFAPGTAFQYSDSNYILLGLVIQKVEGRPVGTVLRKRIINPLKLSQTSWPGASAALPKPHAQGYTLQGQSSHTPANATNWNPSYAWAAGEMISSVSNLLVYGRALGTGKGLLRPQQQRARLHSFHPNIPPETATLSYGIGLVNDRGWIGHTGQVPGYTTAVYYRPDIDTTVVVEANSDIVSGSCPAQPTLIDDPITRPCAIPADRIMGAVAASLRHPYQLPPG
ncbi:MAG: serine hydrolase domain-containing protein [Solirubrobacteraceae bacterium]